MKTNHTNLLVSIFTATVAVLLLPDLAFAQVAVPAKRGEPTNLDVRTNGDAAVTGLAGKSAEQIKGSAQRQQIAAGRALAALKTRVPGAEAEFSPVTGAVETVRATEALTPAAPGKSGTDIVRDFVRENRALYGVEEAEVDQLGFLGESVSEVSGLRMVRVEQRVNGRPVFQSETRFTLDRNGRLVRSVGLMVPEASASALPLDGLISASKALESALASVGIAADAAGMTLDGTTRDGAKTEVNANHAEVVGKVASEIVYFPLAAGSLVPAWSQVAFTSGSGDWYTLVDARTGALLWRKNIRAHASTQEARFSVYVQADGKTPADSPSPLSPTTVTPGSGTQPPEIARTIVSMSAAQSLTASPNGWITDGATTTTGNNVDAYLDRNSDNVPDGATLDNNGRPVGNVDTFGRNRDFLGPNFAYTPPPTAGNPESGTVVTDGQFQRGGVTHLFYLANWYHDRLFALGFDVAAGNFQTNNFGGGGLGNDPVLAEAQDAAANAPTNSNRNNANFSTPPDGQSGRMQMYIFPGPTVDRDGGLDAEIVIHELTHGLSNRLVGNGAGLQWAVGGGMGEGWSDFYALSLLNNTNADNPNARFAAGAYATYKLGGLLDNYLYGIRRFPYCTDNAVNPLTWADVDDTTNNIGGGIAPSPLNFNGNGGLEVHNVGEVWAMTLWEVRSRVIADPAGANGDVPTGNNKMLQITTDALKMTPINPTFLQARDALLDADLATNAGANENSIWAGFADRGLGYGALCPVSRAFGYVAGHLGLRESFSLPYLDVQSVAFSDSLGNNNGAIDPGEPIKLTVKLKNPWRNAGKGVASATATLSSATPGVSIVDGSSTYPAIPAQGSADGDTFLVTVPAGATAGQSLKFTVTVTSALGTKAVDFALRVGTPGGIGAPITYTRTIPGGLAIPDGAPRGVVDTFNIADDYEIADLNFRVDSLIHTYTGDLTVMLKAPGSYGTDLISLIGGLVAGGGSGDNLINMVIDDQASADMVTATPAAAPHTGSWKPVFNAPSLNSALGTIDPVGSLSRLNGTSTQGDWKVLVSDQGTPDTGTLNAWSLIVTPRVFTVASFTPSIAVTGTKTVAGAFTPGGSVTYTIVLTNNGSASQTDNPGNEYSDVLPSQLTLVSANATSGTAVATIGTNTVTWNGGIALGGGSVTITVTATVNAGTDGQTITSQGTIAYDSDVNGSNDSAALTDDPGLPGASDPTSFVVVFNDPPGLPVLVAAKGDAVPGEPAGTIYTSFGIPSLDGNIPGYLATIHPASGSSMKAVIGGNPAGVLARTGEAAPDVAGATFRSFKDPVFGGGHFAFRAIMSGPLSTEDTGLWSNAFGTLKLLAQEGKPAPGVTGGIFKTFVSLALPPAGGAVFAAKIEQDPAGPIGSVSKDNDGGLWRETNAGAVLILREGDSIAVDAGPLRIVKSFAVLTAVSGSLGQRHSFVNDGSLLIRVSFDDGTQGLIEAPGNGSALDVGALTGDQPALLPGAKLKKFGFPSAGESSSLGVLATLQSKLGGVTSGNDSAVFTGPIGGALSVAVREGQVADGTGGGLFKKFKDPAFAGPARLAFLGTLDIAGAVTKSNDTGIWTNVFGSMQLIARESSDAAGPNVPPVPDVADAHFASFTSLALPATQAPRGPVFLAKLLFGPHGATGPGGINKTNYLGLWATGTSGTTKLLLRTGDSTLVHGTPRTIKSFSVLRSVSGSPGQGRFLNQSGKIIYKLTLDGSQAIFTTQIP